MIRKDYYIDVNPKIWNEKKIRNCLKIRILIINVYQFHKKFTQRLFGSAAGHIII